MKIGIIGAGKIGENAARHFIAAGHEVMLSNSRGPGSLRDLVSRLGPRAKAGKPADAIAFGDVVMLAVNWSRRGSVLRDPKPFAGKIVIDAMNPYTENMTIEDLGKTTSSETVAAALPGARVVKAFNTIYYKVLAHGNQPPGSPERVAIPIAGDDAEAKSVVARLIEEIGFSPVDVGPLSNGRYQEPNTSLYNRNLTEDQLRAAFASATA